MVTATVEDVLGRAKRRRSLPTPAARRALREACGLSQGDVGRLLGVDPSTPSRWESGRRTPRGTLLDAYAELLDRFRQEVVV